MTLEPTLPKPTVGLTTGKPGGTVPVDVSFGAEPALWLAGGGAVVEAVLVLLVSFGVPISVEQKGAINALVTVIVTLVTGVAIRSQVSPVTPPH